MPVLHRIALSLTCRLDTVDMYTKLQTLGNLTRANPQNHIDDIGCIAARCIVDPRTVNKFIQFDKRRLSQKDMFDLVEKFYPGRRFETVHVSSEDIIHGSKHGSETTSSAAGGHEPDRERHGINFCCWVDDRGVFGPYNDSTLNAGMSRPKRLIHAAAQCECRSPPCRILSVSPQSS
jgi:hypothetical protein